MGITDWLRGTPKKNARDLYVSGSEAVPHWERSTMLPTELQHPFVLLLVNMMEEDGHIDEREYAHICSAIIQRLGMDDYGARDLVETVLHSPDQRRNNDTIVTNFNRHASAEQRQLLIKELQQVAIADEKLHPLEVKLLNKIATVLGMRPIDNEHAR
ncbi:MAG: TerB family tellurite resistance protein [Mariprofundales bacterium]